MPDQPLTLKIYRLRLRQSFNLSKASAIEKTTLIARFGSGVGEGSPSIHYGVSAEEAQRYLLDQVGQRSTLFSEASLKSLWESLPDSMNVARCALEMACLDLQAKDRTVPLYRHHDLPKPPSVNSSFTITPGSDDEIESQLETAEPFDVIKLKVGFKGDLDLVDRVLARRTCRLRLDANGGWTAEQSIDNVRSLAGYPVEFFEQPISDPSLSDLDKIKSKTGAAIFLDESVITPADIDKYSVVIDGVNLKLAKCGGISRTIAMARQARERGLKLLLGCMIETAIGITAALHLASLFDYFDLDSLLLTENDPYWGAHFEGQTMLLPAGSGIGVTVEDTTLA